MFDATVFLRDAKLQNFQITQSDSLYVKVEVERDMASGGLLEHPTILWRVKRFPYLKEKTLIEKRDGNGIELDGTNVMYIILDEEDTANLSGQYHHECMAILPEETEEVSFTGRPQTILEGTLTVVPANRK